MSRCPSFSLSNNVIPGPFKPGDLPQLKEKFAREVKRNLFRAYLDPRKTIINFISTTTSSSAAFPGGEAFDFVFSPNGHWVLALCSSRIYVIDTASPKVSVVRELKVRRRTVSAAILDDGSLLAVSSSNHKVNIYNLVDLDVRYIRSVALDNVPHAIALSPKGEVLAAAYVGGVEVHSLAPNAVSTDQRSVKCDFLESLEFSHDGTILLGTTKKNKKANTVILSAPYYSEDSESISVNETISHVWTSQILFPNSSHDCSHATLLPRPHEGDATWTFTYDRVFESFRAVRTDDLRNGTTYFTGPRSNEETSRRDGSKRKLSPCTLPATSDRGELVAAGFLDKDVWMYGVPESLDTQPSIHLDDGNTPSTAGVGGSSSSSDARIPATSLTRGESAELTQLPAWQVLVDKHRNVFAQGRQVAEVPGIANLRWFTAGLERPGPPSLRERLIIAAPGGVSGPSDLEQDEFASVDGGRLIILDFDRTPQSGVVEEMTLEIGDVKPELLEEENLDMDAEVDLARRRTVRQRGHGSMDAIVADVLSTDVPPVPALPPGLNREEDNPPDERETVTPGPPAVASSPQDGLSLEEASAFFDGPYSHTQPRSRASLYRSATAVAANRRRNPPTRILESGHVTFRRPDGRGELPHESDADNWVPPPPPYTAKSENPLPEELRASLLSRPVGQAPKSSTEQERLRRSTTMYESPMQNPSGGTSSLPNRSAAAHLSSEPGVSSPSQGTNRPLSSVSSIRFSNSTPSDVSVSSPRSQSSSLRRRPVTAYAGAVPRTAHLISPISPVSQSSNAGRSNWRHSVSLPSSPTRAEPSGGRLTLSGANLDNRLEYPLPPAPSNVRAVSNQSSTNHPPVPPVPPNSRELVAESLPSAQQLANLQNRFTNRPRPNVNINQQLPAGIPIPLIPARPAPPRGALGAAGNPMSMPTPKRGTAASRAAALNNSFARSSPALLRPTPRRLDTIESVTSFLSRERTRSRGRDENVKGDVVMGRSHSAGRPGEKDLARRKTLWGRKGTKSKAKSTPRSYDSPREGRGEKGQKCVIM